jgi:hypothetical protein
MLSNRYSNSWSGLASTGTQLNNFIDWEEVEQARAVVNKVN